ncbi:hypothetical protein PIB30_051674 [Stylosanthes scabra]|uniref:Uncharacterized protein n=1 Tax=Stylosanthes scabra TaxID=79078 RepID=A0ABU6SIE0_9FABA|nr:hypothetical protein [Stylosanthes scabra]
MQQQHQASIFGSRFLSDALPGFCIPARIQDEDESHGLVLPGIHLLLRLIHITDTKSIELLNGAVFPIYQTAKRATADNCGEPRWLSGVGRRRQRARDDIRCEKERTFVV